MYDRMCAHNPKGGRVQLLTDLSIIVFLQRPSTNVPSLLALYNVWFPVLAFLITLQYYMTQCRWRESVFGT